ncbi:MAG: glutathione-disulfide reductase [Gammaproteobacteria bacterium]
MAKNFDLFVIGAGSGGMRAARLAASLGARVAIAEERYLGGTCVNVGCVPKKLFVYASAFGEEFRQAQGFGWSRSEVTFDWSTLIGNKDQEIQRLHGVYRRLLEEQGVTILNGRAQLSGAHTVVVRGQSYQAERILIATGAWPTVPDIPGKALCITSNEVFSMASLPKRLVIVGGGYIAAEFASIFHGMGVETQLVYRGPLFLRGFDRELRSFLAEEMRTAGIDLRFGATVRQIASGDNALNVYLDDERLKTDRVMYATGRRANTHGLGLEQVGVRLSGTGAVAVNDGFQSSMPSIYALGDVIDRVKLTPVALAEAAVFARNMFGGDSRPLDYRGIPTAVFSQPNLASVGLSEEQARAEQREIDVYRSVFTPLKYALSSRKERALVKLIVDRASDRILGAHMVGADAAEIIQGIAIALQAGATKHSFDTTLGIHPTLAEEFVSLAQGGAL